MKSLPNDGFECGKCAESSRDDSSQNDESVEETVDCLIKLLYAACTNNAAAKRTAEEDNARLVGNLSPAVVVCVQL